jgi:hypothetical protein
MNVVGSSYVIEDDKPITLLSLKEPVEPALPILGKLQKRFLLVTTMGDVLVRPHPPIRTGQRNVSLILRHLLLEFSEADHRSFFWPKASPDSCAAQFRRSLQ